MTFLCASHAIRPFRSPRELRDQRLLVSSCSPTSVLISINVTPEAIALRCRQNLSVATQAPTARGHHYVAQLGG